MRKLYVREAIVFVAAVYVCGVDCRFWRESCLLFVFGSIFVCIILCVRCCPHGHTIIIIMEDGQEEGEKQLPQEEGYSAAFKQDKAVHAIVCTAKLLCMVQDRMRTRN